MPVRAGLVRLAEHFQTHGVLAVGAARNRAEDGRVIQPCFEVLLGRRQGILRPWQYGRGLRRGGSREGLLAWCSQHDPRFDPGEQGRVFAQFVDEAFPVLLHAG